MEGDVQGTWRMYQDVLQSFEMKQLEGILGFDGLFNQQELEMLMEPDVFVESDVASVLEFESLRDAVRWERLREGFPGQLVVFD